MGCRRGEGYWVSCIYSELPADLAVKRSHTIPYGFTDSNRVSNTASVLGGLVAVCFHRTRVAPLNQRQSHSGAGVSPRGCQLPEPGKPPSSLPTHLTTHASSRPAPFALAEWPRVERGVTARTPSGTPYDDVRRVEYLWAVQEHLRPSQKIKWSRVSAPARPCP